MEAIINYKKFSWLKGEYEDSLIGSSHWIRSCNTNLIVKKKTVYFFCNKYLRFFSLQIYNFVKNEKGIAREISIKVESW